MGFCGLVPICINYLESEEAAGRCSHKTITEFHQYCDVLIKRTRSELLSAAQFMRKFISSHPDYKKDSIITPSISHDLTVLAVNIGLGYWNFLELHGPSVCSIMQHQAPLYTTKIKLPQMNADGNSRNTGVVIFNVAATQPPHPSSPKPQRKRSASITEREGSKRHSSVSKLVAKTPQKQYKHQHKPVTVITSAWKDKQPFTEVSKLFDLSVDQISSYVTPRYR